MNALFAKLNLQPQERRLVVAVGLIFFVVLNFFFIWPRFGDWKKLKKQQGDQELNIARYQRLLDQVTTFKKDLNKLETQGGQVATMAQALALQDNVYSQASLSGVQVSSYTPLRGSGTTQSNQFFEEQSGTIAFFSGESELVDFLYSLSSGSSMIRVLSMTLQPDKDHLKLSGTMTLVASYQRSTPLKTPAAGTPSKTNAPAAKATSPLSGGGKTNKPPVKPSAKPAVLPGKSTNAPVRKP